MLKPIPEKTAIERYGNKKTSKFHEITPKTAMSDVIAMVEKAQKSQKTLVVIQVG